MKIRILSVLLIAALCISAGFSTSAKTNDEIVLKDGRILKKPYVISRTPSGLNVGHENGVIFVPFTKMSEKRQKQYNYNPKESKTYKKKIAKAQRTRQIRIAKKKKRAKKTSTGSFSYEPTRFPEQSVSSQLQDELAELIREKSRLEKERTRVNSGRINPRGGHSDNSYTSYRGGKVYRSKRSSYAEQTTKNVMNKRKRLKKIASELQKNSRRTTAVRNLIARNTSKGIKKGKTML